MRNVQQVLPSWRRVDRLRHEVCDLLLGVDVDHAHLRVGADLKQPMDIDAVCSKQVPQRHRSRLLDVLHDGLIVLCDDEDCGASRLSRVHLRINWCNLWLVRVRVLFLLGA